MGTTIANLWIPAVWVQSMRERMAHFPALWNSGVVATSELFNAIATGQGINANIPFLYDISDQLDEVQVEDTSPVNDNAQPGAVVVAAICNRVYKASSNALSKQLSGAMPMAAIIDTMVPRRLKQRQTTLINVFHGLFGTGGNANANAALQACRYAGVNGQEVFTENGAGAQSVNLIDPDKIIDTSALLGELEDALRAGAMLCHQNVKARIRKLDRLNFRTLVMQSQLPWTIEAYCDVPIFTSDYLARPGQQSGYVYDTYFMAKGTVAYGEKPQQGDTNDVASLQYFRNRDLNQELIWDRTRFMLGINGVSYNGQPANPNNGPANAEFAQPGAWALKFQSANRVGITSIRTNG
ncbi:MAG TPA: hypothetical protein VGJ73_21240 [Verrucomicrobiae bacterium]|jgi:hypothetical protein